MLSCLLEASNSKRRLFFDSLGDFHGTVCLEKHPIPPLKVLQLTGC